MRLPRWILTVISLIPILPAACLRPRPSCPELVPCPAQWTVTKPYLPWHSPGRQALGRWNGRHWPTFSGEALAGRLTPQVQLRECHRVVPFVPMRYPRRKSVRVLHYNPGQGDLVGGNFWDMRATGRRLGNPAAEQAQGPPTNPVEMGLPDIACAVYRASQRPYRAMFESVWELQALRDRVAERRGAGLRPAGATARRRADAGSSRPA
jgi:di-heme cytochrome c peroxidase